MSEVMFIPRRFCGPPDSANGGYVCGLMAGFVGGTAEVRLRKPPPLERPLAIIRTGGKKVCLMDGETLVAEAAPAVLELETPPPPSYTEALEAMRHYVSEDEHFFPPASCAARPGRKATACGSFPDRCIGKAWPPRYGFRTKRSPTAVGWCGPSSSGRPWTAPARGQ